MMLFRVLSDSLDFSDVVGAARVHEDFLITLSVGGVFEWVQAQNSYLPRPHFVLCPLPATFDGRLPAWYEFVGLKPSQIMR